MKRDRTNTERWRIESTSKRAVAFGLLVAVATLAPRAWAAEAGPALDPRLELLRPLVGKTWSGALRSPDGRQVTTEVREFQLFEGGHVVKITKVNRDLGRRGEGFVYWDDVRKEVGFFFIESGGVVLSGKVTGDGKVVTFEGTMSWPTPPPRPDLKQSYDFKNTFELLSEKTLRDSWFHNAFGPWRAGHVIEFEAMPPAGGT